jgi:hypothetical protein
MNHLQEFANSKKFKIYRKYSMDNDTFIREVWCAVKEKYLTKDKKYRLYAEFKTDAMLSGKCFVVFADNKQFIGFDSQYFLEEYQWVAVKKYNL